jgi:hypothetical protein
MIKKKIKVEKPNWKTLYIQVKKQGLSWKRNLLKGKMKKLQK